MSSLTQGGKKVFGVTRTELWVITQKLKMLLDWTPLHILMKREGGFLGSAKEDQILFLVFRFSQRWMTNQVSENLSILILAGERPFARIIPLTGSCLPWILQLLGNNCWTTRQTHQHALQALIDVDKKNRINIARQHFWRRRHQGNHLAWLAALKFG